MLDKFWLGGKVAVLTGGFGKLGLTWASALLAYGASVLAFDVPSAELSESLLELQKKYTTRQLHFCRGNVTSKDDLESIAQYCLRELGTPEILVNNAGIDQPPASLRNSYLLEEIPADIFREVIDVNLIGAFLATQIFGRYMVKAGKGSIINLGSLYAGVSPDARLYDHIECTPPFLKPPAYGASKAALVNITKYFATHWASSGVRVNTLSPGGVLGAQDEEFKHKFCSRVPMGRMAMQDDLVGPFIFLASDASSYVTGINLCVDGGFTAW